MFRNDCQFTCYEIEMWGTGGSGPKRWHGVHDAISKALDVHAKIAPKTTSGPYKDNQDTFHASGACWQEHGIHGVYDKKVALLMVPILLENYPNGRFRIVERTYSQSTREIATVSGETAAA